LIEVEGLTRRFGDLLAVDHVSFTARSGEITALLGPNGAGKTTTLAMISGVLAPTSGDVRIGGISVRERPIEAKKLLGVVPQEIALYDELSARENLEFWGALHGLRGRDLGRRIEDALRSVDLDQRRDPVSKFSGGMKRRLNLAAGMLHRPRVLLLDEPTAGIDVQARAHILDVVKRAAVDGAAVLYTTHYLEEAEQICERVAIIDHGRILADDTVDRLKHRFGEASIVAVRGTFDEPSFRARVPVEGDARFPEPGRAILSAGTAGAPRLLERILGSGLAIDDVTVREPSLQNVFLQLTGRELRD